MGEPRSRVGVARGAAVLAACGLLLVPTGRAAAAPPETGTHSFEYGTDVSSWYWDRQFDQEVAPPAPLPPPAPPVSQRVRLPSPQRPDTLPVGVNQGQQERMAAIKFDLSFRNVTPGSKITKLVLRMEESQDHNEWPSYSPEKAKIQACPIQDVLSPGENEQFTDRPAFADSGCVEGVREVPAGKPPLWTWDLTSVAQPWGDDPFGNNGVMLLGVIPPGTADTWQINLKVPARDNVNTPDNEYDLTKGRATMDLAFVAGDPLGTSGGGGGSSDEEKSGGGTKGAGGGSPLGTTTTTTGGATGGFVPSTDLTGTATGGEIPGAPASSVPATAPTTQSAPVAAVGPPEPRLPAYVWLLIPLGLLGLTAVRSVVLEPVGGPRPDGVIAAIRRRNAERRGGPLRELTDPVSRAVSAFRRGAGSTRRALSGAGKRFSMIARSVRRK